MVIHIDKLYIHAAVVTHICIYSSEPCTNVLAPNKKYTGTWYTNQYKQQYCIPVHMYVLTKDTVDHEQVWQPYAVDPYYSAISKWWPYLLALYT